MGLHINVLLSRESGITAQLCPFIPKERSTDAFPQIYHIHSIDSTSPVLEYIYLYMVYLDLI